MYYFSKQAFTLLELIILVSILSILSLISFLSFKSFSLDARDSKRVSDVTNLVTKVKLEKIKGVPLSTIVDAQPQSITLGGTWHIAYHGTVNFDRINQKADLFKDPLTSQPYVLSYTMGKYMTGSEEINYDFFQWCTINERNHDFFVKWVYYPFENGDSPTLFQNSQWDFLSECWWDGIIDLLSSDNWEDSWSSSPWPPGDEILPWIEMTGYDVVQCIWCN